MDKQDAMALAGRLLLATVFLASAFGKITNFEETTRYMEIHGMPMTTLFCALAIAVESLGGISLILGYHARWGAAGLAGFLVAATAIFHLGADQRIHLLKNFAILGGLFQVMAYGAGDTDSEERQRPR